MSFRLDTNHFAGRWIDGDRKVRRTRVGRARRRRVSVDKDCVALTIPLLASMRPTKRLFDFLPGHALGDARDILACQLLVASLLTRPCARDEKQRARDHRKLPGTEL